MFEKKPHPGENCIAGKTKIDKYLPTPGKIRKNYFWPFINREYIGKNRTGNCQHFILYFKVSF